MSICPCYMEPYDFRTGEIISSYASAFQTLYDGPKVRKLFQWVMTRNLEKLSIKLILFNFMKFIIILHTYIWVHWVMIYNLFLTVSWCISDLLLPNNYFKVYLKQQAFVTSTFLKVQNSRATYLDGSGSGSLIRLQSGCQPEVLQSSESFIGLEDLLPRCLIHMARKLVLAFD